MVAALENALGTGEHSTSIDEPFKRRVFERLPPEPSRGALAPC